ncbi:MULTISPECIES: hypothetical protein [unclassified Streptomyces]|uniref:hypothetical protein n=1 Tax=unclassified Streptomyces TaxID=2593676 RepID=UPI0035AB8F51
MTAEPLPDWFPPPPGGWTVDDPDRIPPSAPRFELIDGALVTRSPQTGFHSQVVRRLAVPFPMSIALDSLYRSRPTMDR